MQRENWIDWAKTIGILLVVMGHVDTNLEKANMLISAFHMPLFFVISGYLSYKSSTVNKGGNVSKLIKTLLIPYLLYQLINYPYWLFASYKMGRITDPGLFDLVIKPINGILIGNAENTAYSSMICGPMWFVMAMFMLKLGFDYLSRLKDRYLLLVCLVGPAIVVLLKMIDIRLVFSIDCALLALPFFCSGYWMKKYNVLKKKSCILKQLCIAVLCAVLLIFTTRMNGFVFMAGAEYGRNILLFFVQAFAGIFMVFSICLLLDKVKIRFVILISSGTLFILGLQGMVLSAIRQYFLNSGFFHFDFGSFSLPAQFALQFTVGVAVLGLLYFPMLWAEKRYPILTGKTKKLTIK